jgi:hypothetical protein
MCRIHEERLLCRNVKRFQGGLVFNAHRLLFDSTLGLRVIKKKKKNSISSRLHERSVHSYQDTSHPLYLMWILIHIKTVRNNGYYHTIALI